MNLLTIEDLTKSYTDRQLFDHVSFSLGSGEKVGVIGINGTGKSTLLRIAAGLEEPDGGTVSMGNGLHVRYLPQTPVFKEGSHVLSCVLAGNVTEQNKWDIESQAKAMLNTLDIPDFMQPVEELSGGQRKRVALANTLLSSADILVLDEPTNHLDSEMAGWLEDYLKRFRGAVIMVTHDRYFLDSVCSRIVELDKGRLYSYQANYSGFLQRKAEREAMALAAERKRQSLLKTELAWMMRGARARSTKQKAHIQRFEELLNAKAPESDASVEINSIKSRLGKTTVELHGISKSYGKNILLKDFTYIFLKDDRIGVIGRNGCGKSTLMKIIMGAETPDEGELVVGQTVKLGYFSQENEYMDLSLRVIDYIRNVAEYVPTADGSISASQMLERFLFPPDIQYTVIERLSGGERRRLYLLRVLMEAPNVLILDEPTNDLDIQTLMVLEDYLDTFPGIVIAVSHDRYFLDRVTRRIFAFEENGALVQYEGGYTDYQTAAERKRAEQEALDASGKSRGQNGRAGGQRENGEQPAAQAWKQDSRMKPRKLKFTFQEQRDFETIEGEIEALETEISEKEAAIEEAAADYGRLGRLMEEKQELESRLEEKMERWMYLEDLAARIEAGETVSK
ncbi:ABC-F family ATP-binding cassette domain-containing protein [Qiania dongpingensis]|uniref:ABC-F family ATP-binding cassette domain-containing protein n=1 Tax=Qiania dongpingensis TaxID=2763669 RepID=A0A7G9G310_9FIRM|nr:ABC-F family ATP-binding cassette domain-containing protein [Qiania dongpingensis]QNM05192.1 ABC-F family ATP-binding cassette domain-containing protein [Qiania dongpingensis]